MDKPFDLIVGEYPRSLDERHRVSIPTEMAEPLAAEGEPCILAKERPGCLSLWSADKWREKMDAGVDLVQSKIRAGKLEGRIDEVQLLGRLLSTRHKEVKIAGRGRLLIPEGFREFLRVEPGGDVLVIGAAVCVELWHPDAWLRYLNKRIPRFKRLLESLAS